MEAILLAAGSSTRLGQCKLHVTLWGEPLIERMCRLVAGCLPVTVVLREGDARSAERLGRVVARFPVRSVTVDEHVPQSVSIRRGVEATSSGDLLIALADQYRLRRRDLKSLLHRFSDNPELPCAAAYDNIVGVPAAFPASWKSKLIRLDADAGAGRLLRGSPIHTIDMPQAAFDLDTPADLEALREFEECTEA